MIVTRTRQFNQNEIKFMFIFYNKLIYIPVPRMFGYIKSLSHAFSQAAWTRNSIRFTISTSIEPH
jgi:hypothetical protein